MSARPDKRTEERRGRRRENRGGRYLFVSIVNNEWHDCVRGKTKKEKENSN